MRKILYSAMLLLGMSIFCSCSKEGGSTGGSSWIVGNWVFVENSSSKEWIDTYVNFSNDGFMTVYGLTPLDNCAKLENGNLITPASESWTQMGVIQYTLRGDNLHFVATADRIEKKDKDTFVLTGDSDFAGTYYRIKSMKTK